MDISYESVRRWFLKFGAPIAQNLRHMRPIPNGYWHLDEMVIVIRGQRYWLWRAIDNGGEVLDFLVQSKRNAKAALKLMRKLLKKQGWTPTRITTDKLRSYHVAIRTLGLTAQRLKFIQQFGVLAAGPINAVIAGNEYAAGSAHFAAALFIG